MKKHVALETVRELGLVFGVYLALALAVTFPAALHLDTAGVGDATHPLFGGDLFVCHVMEEAVREGNLLRWYVTREVNFPVGEALSPSIVHSLNPYLSLPFTLLLPPIAAHNVVSLLVLAANGLAMYLAARGLLRSRLAAFVAGVVFAFNTYTMLKIGMGSVHKSLIAFFPLFVWALHRLGMEPGWKRSLVAALALTLVYQQYPLYGLYALIFVPVYVAWDQARHRDPRRLVPFAGMLGAFAVATYAVDLVLGLSATHSHVVFRPSGSLLPLPNGYFDVLRPFRFFLPMPTARWFGLPLVATVAAVVVAFRVRGLPRFLLVASGVFLVLSAGPFLLWDGRPVQVAGHYVALPYRVLDLVIPMTYGRTLTFPLRCVAVVTTGLGFLAGAFIVWLTTWLPRDRRLLGAAGFLALYLGECFLRFPDLFPVPSIPAQVPAFFRDLAHQEGGALLHLPLALPIERNWTHRQCLLSVLADRPMVNFHEAMEPSVAMTPGPMTPAADRDRFLETIARQGVEWIVVHRPQLTGARPGLNAADYGWLEECCGPPAFDAEGIRAYRVPGIGR